MKIKIVPKEKQAYGAFNEGEIVENKPVGFPQDGGEIRPYSNIFYWANAFAKKESTIGLHPHKGFEIMSFVLEGRIRHFDTKQNDWKNLRAGDVQIIRSGNGISHAEHMEENARMFQIWLDPDIQNSLQKDASYDDYKKTEFPVEEGNRFKKTIYSGKGSPLTLDTEKINIYRVQLDSEDHSINLDAGTICSIYILEGSATIGEQLTKKDDFILVSDVDEIKISGQAELFVIESPEAISYKTYAELMLAGR